MSYRQCCSRPWTTPTLRYSCYSLMTSRYSPLVTKEHPYYHGDHETVLHPISLSLPLSFFLSLSLSLSFPPYCFSPILPPSQVHTFPSSPEVTTLLSSLPEQLFFFVANTTSGQIRGFHVITGPSLVGHCRHSFTISALIRLVILIVQSFTLSIILRLVL